MAEAVSRTGDWRKDLLAFAKTQIGGRILFGCDVVFRSDDGLYAIGHKSGCDELFDAPCAAFQARKRWYDKPFLCTFAAFASQPMVDCIRQLAVILRFCGRYFNFYAAHQ